MLHFLSEMDKILQGCALSLIWNKYKDELIMINPINDRGEMISVEEKIEYQASGFFKQKIQSKSIV